MDLAWYIYVLILAGGFLAGVINTLAGSGSLVTLPLLVFLGLPATVANGTNRIGVIVQCFVGVETLRRGGALRTENASWYITPTVLGALIGAAIAASMTPESMETAIGVIMALMFVVILVNPKRWLREESELTEGRPEWWLLLLLFVVGVYGGFIQAGVGILMLATLVLGAGFNVVEGNAIKLLIALVFTSGAFFVFLYNDQVNWVYGGMMAVGQSLGAWTAAKFAVQREDIAVWVRRLLIVIVAVSMLKFFGVWTWLIETLDLASIASEIFGG